MAKASTLTAWDAAQGGTLIPLMRELRNGGATYEEIIEAVKARGVNVSASTVYRWCKAVAEQPEAVAS